MLSDAEQPYFNAEVCRWPLDMPHERPCIAEGAATGCGCGIPPDSFMGAAAVSKNPIHSKGLMLERLGPVASPSFVGDHIAPFSLGAQSWDLDSDCHYQGLWTTTEEAMPFGRSLFREAVTSTLVPAHHFGRLWSGSPGTERMLMVKEEPRSPQNLGSAVGRPPPSPDLCTGAPDSLVGVAAPQHAPPDPFADLHMPWLPALDVAPLQAPSPCPELDRSDSSADSPWDIRALHRCSTPFKDALNAQSQFHDSFRTPSPAPEQCKHGYEHDSPAKSASTEQQGHRSSRLRMSTRQQQQRQLAGTSQQVLKPPASTASSSARLLRKRTARLELRGARLVLAGAGSNSTLPDGEEDCEDGTLLRHKGQALERSHSFLPNGTRRKKHHNPWGVDEMWALVDGVQRCGGGRWAEIKKLGLRELARRSAVDLKDKWRNLARVAALPPSSRRSKSDRRREVPLDMLQLVRELVDADSLQKAHASRSRAALHDGED